MDFVGDGEVEVEGGLGDEVSARDGKDGGGGVEGVEEEEVL